MSLPAGSFAFGPKGVPHTFMAETDGARALIGFQPFLFEGFLREVGEPATERVLPPPLEAPPDMARLLPIGVAQRDRDPRAPRPASRPLTMQPTNARPLAQTGGRATREAAVNDATITPSDNGPYLIQGNVALLDAEGNPYKVNGTIALCRCGYS